jgi:hypothetical protein
VDGNKPFDGLRLEQDRALDDHVHSVPGRDADALVLQGQFNLPLELQIPQA